MIKTNNPSTLPSECQGYEIIFSYRVGENTHAIGHNPKKADSYVVWYYTPLGGFFWGKYADSFEKSMTSVKDVRSISECKGCRFAHYTDSQKIFCGFCTKKILAEWRQEKAEREERAKEASGNGRSTENQQLYDRTQL